MRSVTLSCVILTTFFAASLFAQRDLGTVTGSIIDPQGHAVVNARVTILESATGLSYTALSNESGEFVRPLLKPGNYTVTVEAPGFRKAEQKGVLVTAGDRIGVNI